MYLCTALGADSGRLVNSHTVATRPMLHNGNGGNEANIKKCGHVAQLHRHMANKPLFIKT